MISQNSIFYRLTSETENTVTDLFANLLKTKYIRNICLEFMLTHDTNANKPSNISDLLDSIQSDGIQTQFSDTDNSSQPDIKIESDTCYLYLEDKIRNGVADQITQRLDENNKSSYVTSLEEHGGNKSKILIYLIPSAYQHLKDFIAVQNEYKSKKNIFIFICNWEDLLAHLYQQQIDKYSSVVSEALNFIKDTIDSSDQIDTKFTPYEAAMIYSPRDMKEAISAMSKYWQLINKTEKKIIQKVNEQNKVILSPSDWDPDLYNCIKYLQSNGKSIIDQGFNFNLTEYQFQNGKDPLKYVFSVAIDKSYIIDTYIKKLSAVDYFDDGQWIHFPLPKEALFSDNQEESYIKAVTDIIINDCLPIIK